MISSPGSMKRRVLPGSALLPALALVVGISRLTAAEQHPVSWYRDVNPLFKRSCNGCHNPNKLKGEVDTSTYAAGDRDHRKGALDAQGRRSTEPG